VKLRSNAAVKITAGILSVLMLLCAVLSAALWIGAESMEFSTSSYAYLAEETKEALVQYHLMDVWQTWRRGDDAVEVYRRTNLVFRLRDEKGNIIAESAFADQLDEHAYVRQCLYDVYIDETEEVQSDTYVTSAYADTEIGVTLAPSEKSEIVWSETTYQADADAAYAADTSDWAEVIYTLEGDVNRTIPYNDRYSVILTALDLYYELFRVLPFFALGFLILWIVCLCILLRSVGWHKGEDAPRCGWLEYVPYDLLCIGITLFIALHDLLFQQGDMEFVIGLSAFVLADVLILTLFLCTTAVRLKTRSLLKTTLVWYVLLLVWRILCWLGRGTRRICSVTFGALGVAFGSVPLVWKTALGVLVIMIADLVAALYSMLAPGIIFLYLFVKNIILGVLILFCAVIMRRIQAGGEKLAAGDLDAKIDTKYMFGDFRQFSESMNRIGDGMSAAVDERMKSEHLRTELITNVSHDIKTPLTSIVNYVDLIQKENVTDEPLAGYIEVLARQSARLKKLTEDLVEASKAATGNITVQPEELDVSLMLTQTAGEYDEKLRTAKLDLILRQPPEAVHILADGRLLWRVFDNLMNNIVKYAMPGTRVYLTLHTEGDEAEIIFRNIARDELNVASEELFERFTRGDASRSTEGSGLGLSIAKSLTELQGGTLHLTVDGDLFKAAVRLPLSE